MATYDYYKNQQPVGPYKPGSNWFMITVDFSKQNVAAADVLRLMEVKNHWILKSGFTRVRSAADGTATMDIETTAGGDQIDAAVDIDSATDTWLRFDTLDDDGPIALTADSYIFATINAAACSSGIIDILLEIVIPHNNVDAVDSIAEAN